MRSVRSFAVLAVVVPALVAASASTGTSPRQALLGEWRGTSVCTDLVAAPARKDEVVIDHFTPSGRDSALLKAYKVVGGEQVRRVRVVRAAR